MGAIDTSGPATDIYEISREAGRRRLRVPVGVVLAMLFMAVVLVWAIAPSVLEPHPPEAPHLSVGLTQPGSEYLLGTDQLGRDVLSRVIAGARTSIQGPLLVATAALTLSTLLALAAGALGGAVDTVISRSIDFLYSLPSLLVVIVVVGVLGGGYWLALAVVTILSLPPNVRVLRVAVAEQMALPYVEAAQALGASRTRLLLRHLLPNILHVAITGFFIRFTYALVELSTLSFLGLGVAPGTPDWGRMLAENRIFLDQNPWAVIAPALALTLTAVSMNVLGDWFSEVRSRKLGEK